ncbi:MAG: hypothetical protein U1E87_01625 [Alphaproteobacteria bacterium]
MDDNRSLQQATIINDVSRHVATRGDSAYSLSIEDALARYDAESIPRTRRSVQRYCANGALDAHRVETEFGEKFLITPESLDRHIRYIKEVRPVATSHDQTRPVATNVAVNFPSDVGRNEFATADDMPRQPATAEDKSRPVATEGRYVELLERENEFLRDQIAVKDKQIADQSERVRETNLLVNGLQRLIAPLLSGPNRNGDARAEF